MRIITAGRPAEQASDTGFAERHSVSTAIFSTDIEIGSWSRIMLSLCRMSAGYRVYIFLFLALSIISMMIGSNTNWTQNIFDGERIGFLIKTSRLPRLVALALAGAGLSICGIILQQIVRNKFVEPATSGGVDAAKLGLLVALTLVPGVGVAASAAFAFVFAFAASLVYVAVIARMRLRSAMLVPIIGLMYGGVLTGFAEFYAYNTNNMQNMQGWMLGDFSKIVEGNYEILYIVLMTVGAAYMFARRFTVVGMGQGIARSLGLNYAATVVFGLALVAVTAAATVIAVGAIPFVGLIIPNLIALRHGDNLVQTLPLIALTGANFLIACDIVGRLVIHPFEVPIALTTGLVGGVLFLALIVRRNR